MSDDTAVPSCDATALPGAHLVRATLRQAVAHAARHGVTLDDDGRAPRPPHAAVPAVGARRVVRRTVAEGDTAAAVGHPDADVDVLSTPTIALWFELTASELLPAPGGDVRHLGVGVLVHHHDLARVGDEVVVAATVDAVDGRTVRFACDAWCDDRLVATGDHQRVVVPLD